MGFVISNAKDDSFNEKMMRFSILFFSLLICAFIPMANSSEITDNLKNARIEFASKPDFNPNKLSALEVEYQAKAQKLISENKNTEAFEAMFELLGAYPLSIKAYVIIGESYDWLSKNPSYSEDTRTKLSDLSKDYLSKADLLIQSVSNGTECASINDQCKVISISEEDVVMRKLGYIKTKQELLPDAENNSAFDKVTGTNAQGQNKDFYFDISLLTAKTPSN